MEYLDGKFGSTEKIALLESIFEQLHFDGILSNQARQRQEAGYRYYSYPVILSCLVKKNPDNTYKVKGFGHHGNFMGPRAHRGPLFIFLLSRMIKQTT